MPFTTTCPNKGCGETQAPYLDKDTNKAYCSECHKEITNLTVFVKNQMKMNKQFKPKEKKSFSIKCVQCGVESRPKILNDEVICGSCDKPLDQLTPSFKIMLKIQLAGADKDIG
jgi:hypothetical protein